MRLGVVGPLLLALCCSAPVAAAEGPFDGLALIQSRFDKIKGFDPDAETLSLRVVDDEALDGIIRDDVLTVSRSAVGLLRNRQELDAVLIAIIAFSPRGHTAEKPSAPHAGIGDYLGLVAFMAAKRAADSPDRTHARNLRRPPPRYSYGAAALSGNRQGWHALQLLTEAGSCNGAALDALHRLARAPATAHSPVAGLASAAQAGFGAAALPPDRSCIGG